ncbi:DNA helicase, partial [Tanacetum coccineum]
MPILQVHLPPMRTLEVVIRVVSIVVYASGTKNAYTICPADGEPPWFLQLYIYDTDNEVDNRLRHFGGENSALGRDIVEGLIELLDAHKALVQLFRTAREKFVVENVPDFKIRLYNVMATREYELPTGDMLGGPRYMYSHYLDALAICRVHGNPSFFITFTCNVKWPEITEY